MVLKHIDTLNSVKNLYNMNTKTKENVQKLQECRILENSYLRLRYEIIH